MEGDGDEQTGAKQMDANGLLKLVGDFGSIVD